MKLNQQGTRQSRPELGAKRRGMLAVMVRFHVRQLYYAGRYPSRSASGGFMRSGRVFSVVLFLLTFANARPAAADATAFIGLASNPSTRSARGFAIGASIVIVGFEFEYMNVTEDLDSSAPSLRVGMGNVFVQTPTRLQFYATTGAGIYRERLGTFQETSWAVNSGAGVKIPLAGPIRVRFDYRVINLRGAPLYRTSHRFYAGLNLAF